MSLTLMEHPELGIRKIPLNEWAKYRKAGWVFCNEKSATLASTEDGAPAAPSTAEEPDSATKSAKQGREARERAKTTPKKEA